MSRKNKNSVLDRDITEEAFAILKFLLIAGFAFLVVFLFFKFYNPKKHNTIKRSMYLLNLFQSEVTKIYTENKKVFAPEASNPDMLCQRLAEASGAVSYDCLDDGVTYKRNFVIKKKRIEVYGLEKPPYKLEETYVKDFFIDVDTSRKSENIIGVDRFPLRIYSDNYMGGMITPINCSKDDEVAFSLTTSPVCAGGTGINFLATDFPFGFDVYQVGADGGITRYLNRGIAFLRADCNAYGGEMLAWDDYCNGRYYWHKTCYNDEPCGIQPSKDY